MAHFSGFLDPEFLQFRALHLTFIELIETFLEKNPDPFSMGLSLPVYVELEKGKATFEGIATLRVTTTKEKTSFFFLIDIDQKNLEDEKE